MSRQPRTPESRESSQGARSVVGDRWHQANQPAEGEGEGQLEVDAVKEAKGVKECSGWAGTCGHGHGMEGREV